MMLETDAAAIVRNAYDWAQGVKEDRKASMAMALAARNVCRIVESTDGWFATYKALLAEVKDMRGLIADAKRKEQHPAGLIAAVEMLTLLGVTDWD